MTFLAGGFVLGFITCAAVLGARKGHREPGPINTADLAKVLREEKK